MNLDLIRLRGSPASCAGLLEDKSQCCLAGDIFQCCLLGDKVCNFTMNLSSGEPQYQAKVTIVKAKHAQTTLVVTELFSSTFGHPMVKTYVLLTLFICAYKHSTTPHLLLLNLIANQTALACKISFYIS